MNSPEIKKNQDENIELVSSKKVRLISLGAGGLYSAQSVALSCSVRGYSKNQKKFNQSFVRLITGNVSIDQFVTEM